MQSWKRFVAMIGMCLAANSALGEIVQTKSGCKVEVVKLDAENNNNFEWLGACVNYFAEGFGTLTYQSTLSSLGMSKETGVRHQGRSWGYQVFEWQISSAKSESKKVIRFFGRGEKSVHFSPVGTGLTVDADKTFSTPIPLPNLIPIEPTTRVYLAIVEGRDYRSIQVEMVSCNDSRIANNAVCSGSNSSEQHVIVMESPGQNTHLCPNSNSVETCGQFIDAKFQPYRDEIYEFIRSELSHADSRLIESASVLKLDQDEKRQRLLRAEAEEKSFNSVLESASAGKLFTYADELSSSGNLEKARLALRALVSRFPDHQLAPIAANQLANMGVSAARDPTNAPPASNASSQGVAATACQSTLGYLSERFPQFVAPELRTQRDNVVGQSVLDAILQAKAMGHTSETAISAALQQADMFESTSRQSAECAADVDTLGRTEDDFYMALQKGIAPNECIGITKICFCTSIINRMAAIGTRAVAEQMKCYAGSGAW